MVAPTGTRRHPPSTQGAMANPSILPTDAQLFSDAELDAICEALFPTELTRA